MKRALCLILLLAACKEDAAQSLAPVDLTPETVGYFCQMNLLEHDGPKAQVHLDGLPGAPLFFSQVRDAIAYERMPEQSHAILAIWVNDMGAEGATWASPGAANWIDARTAYFVVGSNQAGGMGTAETVPFKDRAKAEDFARQYGGKVLGLENVPNEAVLTPVTATAGDDSDFSRRLKALSSKTGG